MTRCQRCQWQPTDGEGADREQLRAHALDWTHPLCGCCARSLLDTEPATCEQCIVRAQETLAGVVQLWQDLPRHLGQAKAQVYDKDGRGGAEEHALPGGTVLALLAPGSVGNVLSRSGNREHLKDNWADSTPSVAWTLMSWEDDWRRTRGDEAAQAAGTSAQVARAAAGYLERHTRWAANQHDAFPEYAGDMQDLHSRLEVASGRVRHPVKAGASCFDCGGTLERPLHEVSAEASVFPWWIPFGIGPRREQDMPNTTRVGPVENENVVRCRQCGSSYDGARYLLALAARRQEGAEDLAETLDLDGWVSYKAAAAVAQKPLPTLWSWVQRLQVTAVCRVSDRARLVWYPDVDARVTSRKNDSRGAA